MNETRELATFAAQLTFERLPVEIIKKTQELILDQLGVQVSSSIKPWCQGVYRTAKELNSRGTSTILHYGDKVGADLAAFVNGTFGHGFEIDDTYPRGNLHPGCAVVAAAMAVGEREHIGGKALLLAVVTGYEVMGRVGRAMIPSLMERGRHPTASVGPLGSSAAVSKVLGFTPQQTLNSLSIASSLGSGTMEFSRSGGNFKRIFGGIAAQAGVRAALLVQNGLTGPPTALEGKAGFCHAYADGCRFDDMVDDLGKNWVITDVAYKRYHTDYMIQSLIDAVLAIRKRYNINLDEVEEIIAGTNQIGFHMIGNIVEPQDINGAQFSAPFCLGMALVRGTCGFRDFVDESLSDGKILAVARKVKVEWDQEIQATYPAKRAGKVTIRLKDGRIFQEKVIDLKGTPSNPMSSHEVEDKFRSLASVVLPERKIEEVVQILRDLEGASELSGLCKLLVR